MKMLYVVLVIAVMSEFCLLSINPVYAPCPVGVTSCGPPPGVTVDVGTDNQFYEKNDTINIQGNVYVQNYSKPIHLQLVNPANATILGIDAPVSDGSFNTKIVANFDVSGTYQIITCLQNWCDRSYFKFSPAPYKLTASNQDFFIKYKGSADLVGMEADVNSHALRVHIANATAQGLEFVIDVPRALIDSKGSDNKDASFQVLVGMNQPDKYMQPVNYREIASNVVSRTLAIDIPYAPVPNASGVWDYKIMPSDDVCPQGVQCLGALAVPDNMSPLQMFKAHFSPDQIHCKPGLYLAIKSHGMEPVCLKAGTISKLASRGFFHGVAANATETNYTTILISPGSENQASSNSYSPSVATVMIGVNNTIRWVSQSETANTIVPDMPLTQNGRSFGSDGVIKPGGTYMFTFTEPGMFPYHTEPHPWMKGTIIVLSQDTSPSGNGTVVLGEGQRDGPLLVQKILKDNVQGLAFREYPLATNTGYPITLHVGDIVSNGCTVDLTLVKIENNTATFLKKEHHDRVCPICLSENTVIDTPNGQTSVQNLKPGMAVFTQDSMGHKQSSTILKTGRTLSPQDHQMVHVVLYDSRKLDVSQNHPTADGRFFGDLHAGDLLDGSKIKSTSLVPYNGTYTYDILPDGKTGFYWADGILVGSTLK